MEIRATARIVNSMRGVGIASIEKTSTEGLVDTYTITYTDGTTSTFEVTNGQTVDVDSFLDYISLESTNPVQNKVLGEAYNNVKPLAFSGINIPNSTAVVVEDIITALSQGRGVSVTFTRQSPLIPLPVLGGTNVTAWRYDGTSVYGYNRTAEGKTVVFKGTATEGADEWEYEVEEPKAKVVLTELTKSTSMSYANQVVPKDISVRDLFELIHTGTLIKIWQDGEWEELKTWSDGDLTGGTFAPPFEHLYGTVFEGEWQEPYTVVVDGVEETQYNVISCNVWEIGGYRRLYYGDEELVTKEYYRIDTGELVWKEGHISDINKIDNALNRVSTRPVQNKVLYAELTAIKARLDALEGGNS